VLHCPDAEQGYRPATDALRIVTERYSQDTVRRFVRMATTTHRWTALHMA
jgi:hypothetical protein